MTKYYKRKLSAKRIWIRSLSNGRVAIAEYVNAKRRNLCEPVKLDTPKTLATLQIILRSIDQFQLRTKRQLVAVIAEDDFNAKHVADILGIPIE